jgi:hypothetical protein
MANRFSNISDFEIPTSIIDCHEWMADELIDGPTGQRCRLIYPITLNAVCPNCIFDPRAKKSSGIYKTGGPIPFTNHTTCPWCGGVGRSSRATEADIRLRIYWRESDWKKITTTPNSIKTPETTCMIIGYMIDLPKLEKAAFIRLNEDVSGMRKWLCERLGEATPWGLAQKRYFVQFLERTGGG